ncbi:MAG: MFS transporter, partial [Candidatus Rokubacteria bacterium]|nr:MFS transporter [Candidatus Rokubacteria bacterium]
MLISTLCSVTFLVSSTGTAIAPFLLEMARDLRTELAAVGNLVSVLSVAWGAMSLAAGAASDRLGRRPILVLGVLTLGAARLGLARAETYAWAAAWQLVAGVGGGAYMGTVFAAVSDHVAPAQRGRALGWVITGQSLSLVFGVPLLTFIGSFGGWRGAIAAQAAATLAAALVIRLVVPRASGRRSAEHMSAGSVAKLFNARVLALLGASAMERACFAAMTVYLATFLLTSYGVSLAELAGGLVLVALGNLAGNLLGGQLADRLPSRPLTFAVSSVATAILAFPLMLWVPGFLPSIALGFAYSLANALGRPPLMAALSEVSSEARGAVLG